MEKLPLLRIGHFQKSNFLRDASLCRYRQKMKSLHTDVCGGFHFLPTPRLTSKFEFLEAPYSDAWLTHPEAYALSPDLPLTKGEQSANGWQKTILRASRLQKSTTLIQ